MFFHLKCLPSFRARRNNAIIEVATTRSKLTASTGNRICHATTSELQILKRTFPSASISSTDFLKNWVMSYFFYRLSSRLSSARVFYVFSSDTQAKWSCTINLAPHKTYFPVAFLSLFINSSKWLESSSNIVFCYMFMADYSLSVYKREQLSTQEPSEALPSL